MKYFRLLHTYTWRHWVITYTLVAIFAFSPLLFVMAGSAISQGLGCNDITDPPPSCPGASIISVLFAMVWLGLITFPFGGFVAILLALANILWYFSRKSCQSPE